MKTMAISEFKTHSLQVLGRVARTKEPVVVTKRASRWSKWFRTATKANRHAGQTVGDAAVRERHRLSTGRINLERCK